MMATDEISGDKQKEVRVTIVHNGPLRISGKVVLTDIDHNEEIREGTFSICRCGKSSKSPYCDGTHKNLIPKLDE